MRKVNVLLNAARRQRLVEQTKRLDAPSEPAEVDLFTALCVPRFEADQRDDQLQIIFDPALDLLKQQILVADIPFELLALRPFALGDIDQRGKPIIFRAVITFDHRGVGLDQHRLALALAAERAKKLGAVGDRLAELHLWVVLMGEIIEDRPAPALRIGHREPE